MSEIKQSSEGLKIPDNWNFPERDVPGLVVRQIDLDQRFIAFDFIKGRDVECYADYVFDSKGDAADCRLYDVEDSLAESTENLKTSFTTNIKLIRDHNIRYDLRGNKRLLELGRGYIFVEFEPGANYIGIATYEGEHLQRVDFNKYFIVEELSRKEGQVPEEIDYSDFFITAMKKRRQKPYKTFLEGPSFSIKKGENGWYFDPKGVDLDLEGELKVEREYSRNQLVYLDNYRRKVFRVEWKVDEGYNSEQEREKCPLLFVSQTHIPTDIIKTLSAPLRIDLQKVADAVFARPPYPKDERGRLVVPWRNIDRIVGARLAYSYPPQKQ